MNRVNIATPSFRYDPDDPEGYRAGMHRLGTELGAQTTGISVYELPPGQAVSRRAPTGPIRCATRARARSGC